MDKGKQVPSSVKGFASKYGIIIVFFLMEIIFAVLTNGSSISMGNIIILLRQIAINGVVAVGMTMVIITGGIDLSVGSVLAFSAAIASDFAHPGSSESVVIPFLVAMLIGALCGFVSGTLIAFSGAPPFVITMGMMYIARGGTFLYTGGAPIKDFTDEFIALGRSTFLGLPRPVFIMAIVMIVGAVYLQKSRAGRALYAIGGNEEAAYASGVNVRLHKVSAYAIAGVCAAIGGIILTARTGSASAQAGDGYETNAIAAVVIGGTSLSGGRGSILGSLIGALIIGALSNGLDIMNISSYLQTVIKGVIIITAVVIDARTEAKKK